MVVDEAYSMCGIGAEIIAAVTEAPALLGALKAPPARLHTAASALPFATVLEAEVQVTETKVIAAVQQLFAAPDAAAGVPQSRPLTTEAAVQAANEAAAKEAAALAGMVAVVAPYRVGDVSYWFGIPVTLVKWHAEVGTTVAEGQPLACIRVTAEDLNKPGSTVDTEVEVVAPASGTLTEVLVGARAKTELGKTIATLTRTS